MGSAMFFQQNLLGQQTWQRIDQLMQQCSQTPQAARFQMALEYMQEGLTLAASTHALNHRINAYQHMLAQIENAISGRPEQNLVVTP